MLYYYSVSTGSGLDVFPHFDKHKAKAVKDGFLSAKQDCMGHSHESASNHVHKYLSVNHHAHKQY